LINKIKYIILPSFTQGATLTDSSK